MLGREMGTLSVLPSTKTSNHDSGQDLGDLRERGFRPIVHLVRAGTVEHVVGERHINYALEHLHVDFLQFVASERTREVVGEHKIERVALGLGFHELFDITVGGI